MMYSLLILYDLAELTVYVTSRYKEEIRRSGEILELDEIYKVIKISAGNKMQHSVSMLLHELDDLDIVLSAEYNNKIKKKECSDR